MVAFPNANDFQVVDELFVAAWMEYVDLKFSEHDWTSFAMPKLDRAARYVELRPGFDRFCRILVPHDFRNATQATDAFVAANARIVTAADADDQDAAGLQVVPGVALTRDAVVSWLAVPRDQKYALRTEAWERWLDPDLGEHEPARFQPDLPNRIEFPAPGVWIRVGSNGLLTLSSSLVDLLVDARTHYKWPQEESELDSQKRILDAEGKVEGWRAQLIPQNAHAIAECVSDWAKNRRHDLVEGHSDRQREDLAEALKALSSPSGLGRGLDGLQQLPGIGLVIASKIYRFFDQTAGAAIDRHASFFTNSLEMIDVNERRWTATDFKRRWVYRKNCRRCSSELDPLESSHNQREFERCYLPLLANIATALNALPRPYTCAVTKREKRWRPADVEMAMYHWWTQNSPAR